MRNLVVAAGLFFSVNSFADQAFVRSNANGPFSCEHTQALALADLNRQCSEAKKVLVSYSFAGCFRRGDDGGYVDYFFVEANGICLD